MPDQRTELELKIFRAHRASDVMLRLRLLEKEMWSNERFEAMYLVQNAIYEQSLHWLDLFKYSHQLTVGQLPKIRMWRFKKITSCLDKTLSDEDFWDLVGILQKFNLSVEQLSRLWDKVSCIKQNTVCARGILCQWILKSETVSEFNTLLDYTLRTKALGRQGEFLRMIIRRMKECGVFKKDSRSK